MDSYNDAPIYFCGSGIFCKSPFQFLFICFFLWCVFPVILFSQQPYGDPEAYVLGKSGTVSTSPWSLYANPSGLATSVRPVFGMGYSNDYQLQELSARTLLMVWPGNGCVIAGGVMQDGCEAFNYQQYNVAVARQMAPWLRMAVRPVLTVRHQSGVSDETVFTMDAGFQILPVNNVTLGFYSTNPAMSKWQYADDYTEYYPTTVAVGVAYRPANELEMEFGILKLTDTSPLFSFGITKPVFDRVILRGAVSTSPVRIGLGTSVKWRAFSFDVGVRHHASLGISSSFGLLYYLFKS
ncbi:hypothetical protein ACT3CD_01945 [Geofilum sp. OHC36d9]|uniref:hypothetical protein n=1 Tax=Geofilum sp. OHC36d9 TaxID=3458413 RepID=UPI004033E267